MNICIQTTDCLGETNQFLRGKEKIMNTAQRIQVIRMLEKMRGKEDLCKRLGIADESHFRTQIKESTAIISSDNTTKRSCFLRDSASGLGSCQKDY